MANSKSSEKEMDGKVLYYCPARGGGKSSLLNIINYCRSQGMTDEEIIELWDKAIKRLKGDSDATVE